MKFRIVAILFGLTCVIACRKEPDLGQLSDSFAVQTLKSPDANFSSYKTFFISDTISLSTTDPNDTLWFNAGAKQLVDEVKANMAARGYTFVNYGSHPDLGMSLSVIKDLNLGVVYPGWWWGYWGCYWGWCYYPPYYPSGGYVYSIPTGTLILDMLDLKNAQSSQKLLVPWGSVMSGGLGNTSNDLQLGVEAIRQSFGQSPYIKTN